MLDGRCLFWEPGSGPNLRNRGILVRKVVLQIVARGADHLNGIVPDVRSFVSGPSAYRVTVDVEMISPTGSVPVGVLPADAFHVLPDEGLDTAHSNFRMGSHPGYGKRHEEEIGLGRIRGDETAVHEGHFEIMLAGIISCRHLLIRQENVLVLVLASLWIYKNLEFACHLPEVLIEQLRTQVRLAHYSQSILNSPICEHKKSTRVSSALTITSCELSVSRGL